MNLDRPSIERKVAAAIRLMDRAGLTAVEQDGIIEAFTLGSLLVSIEMVEESNNEG